MPRKSKKEEKKGMGMSFLSNMRWDDSYISLVVGVVVVIIIAALGLMLVKGNRTQSTSSTAFMPSNEIVNKNKTNPTPEPTSTIVPTATLVPTEKPQITYVPKKEEAVMIKPGEKSYVVKSGDSLWSISESYYKSGYNWVDIAKANNLSNPDMVFSGNKLVIPSVTPKTATAITMPSQNTFSGINYTVGKGDDLWNIAVKAYGDGYAWTKIAQANNLTNPNLIFAGNKLKIPR